MNTCAECRFWKDPTEPRFADMRRDGVWKECDRASEINGDAGMFVRAIYAEDAGLMTRSDFGCVQFEAKAEPLEPGRGYRDGESFSVTTMRCGTCRTIWNPATQKHYCPGRVVDAASGVQVGYTFETTKGE